MESHRQYFATWPIGRKAIGLVIALALLLLYTGVALAAPVTVTDDQGKDDEPGQKDLNYLSVDYTPAVNDIAITWGWDDTMWSGANTGDACSLFDTDGDGNANYSMCITVSGAGVFQSTRLYSCTADSDSEKCGGPTELFGFTSTGAASVQTTDPFGTTGRSTNDCDANANCLTNDTVGTLSIKKVDVGGGVAKLVNVCSYPSREPNSDPSDCIFTPGSGFLTIVKIASPNDGTAFVFNTSANSQGGANSWTINGSGTMPLISFAPSTTNDLSEVVPSGWNLDSASCVIQSAPTTATGSFSAVNHRIDNFEIREGLETICTFTNLKPGKLIVKKVVVNDNGGTLTNSNFSFSVNGGSAVAFEADGQNDLTVDAGTYSVVEPAVSGYTAAYDNCSSIVIPNGGTATCTITNTDNAPSLTLVKEVVNNNGGDADPSDLTLTASGPTGFSGAGPTVTNGASFDKGTYTLSESAGPGGYNAGNWSCTGDGTQVSNQITLGLGESATCTIINDDVGAGLTLVKEVNNNNGGTASPSDWTLTATGPTGFSGTGPIVSNGAGFAVGTYTLSESGGVDDYTAGSWECVGGTQDGNDITLAAGESATCTIINDDDAPSLTLVKEVTNNNGGMADPSEWTLVATGASTFSGVGPTVNSDADFNAGSYSLSEFGGPDGYTGAAWSCIGGTQSGDEITLDLGESATCTITNDDDAPKLTLIKQVINDDGGTATPSNWTLSANGPTSFSSVGPEVTSSDPDFSVGTYTLSETAEDGTPGYTASSWSCENGTQNDDEITLTFGEVVTCTITNNDQPATLIVQKVVTNDDGGTKVAGDFTFSINGGTPITFETDAENVISVDAGTYDVTEPEFAGYTTTYLTCENLVLKNGESATCTIFNNDQPGTLIVNKTVINDNGGSKGVEDFSFQVNDDPAIFFNGLGSNELTVNAGIYTVTEPAVTGYTASFSNCEGIVIPNGGTATCSITNDDDPGTLIVQKIVINDNGGTQEADDFTFQVDSGTPIAFEADGENELTVDAGIYSVSEPTVEGYTTTYEGCENRKINNGGTATCTITNDDQPGTLIVEKTVTNDNGGGKAAENFSFQVNGNSAIPFEADGHNEVIVNAGTYTVTEPTVTGYVASYTNCDGLVIPNGGTATCSITNDDQPGTLIVEKTVINDNGGTKEAEDFTFQIDDLTPTSFEADGDNAITLDAGTYDVTELEDSGYTTSLEDCTDIVITNGGTATCSITNDDKPGTLIVNKTVINDNGGGKNADDFTFQVNAGTPITFEVDGENKLTVDAGTYTVTEPAFTGYTTSYTNCEGIVIPNGGTATCTVTNNDQQGTLIVQKTVINDNGGTKEADDFSFQVNDGSPISFEADGENVLSVDAGTYTVTEPAVTGYTVSYSNCANIVVPNGGSKTCTVTNNDDAPSLTLIKEVVNDNGGTESASSWTLTASGPTTLTGAGPEVVSGPSFDTGTYTLTESAGPAGYTAGAWSCVGGSQSGNLITLSLGQSATCTIINNDDAPSLTLVKEVINNSGGSAQPSAWTLVATGPTTLSGDGPTVSSNGSFAAGTYTLSEIDGPDGYAASAWSCVGGTQADDEITIALSETVTCTITNNDQAATLKVTKITTVPSTEAFSFTATAEGGLLSGGAFALTNGTTKQFAVDAGTYTVTEEIADGWELLAATCTNVAPIGASSQLTVTIGNGETRECIFTNDPLPQIAVTKTATTSVVVGTSAVVTFNVTVANTGLETVTLTSLSDSDFGNLDGKGSCQLAPEVVLGPQEVYQCAFSGTVTGNEATPHSNTVTAVAIDDEENEAEDQDSETVIFDQLPAVEVSKSANVTEVVGISGSVSFTIVVSNAGSVPFTITTLVDSDFGNLNGKGTCATGTVIPVGGSYTCIFSGTVNGSENLPHNNTVTVTVADKDGNEDEDEDSETVPFDELPQIEVSKTANVTEVVGTSGNVQFTVVVSNVSNVSVTLVSLTDTDFGNLNGQGTCVTGGVIAVGGSYTCVFTGAVTGNEATPHSNTVTATVKDKDGNEDQDQDSETVPFDQLPVVEVSKSANVTKVVGTSGPVTFTVVVSNAGSVPFTITALSDSDFGNLNGKGTCATGSVIPVGGSYTCAFSGTVTGNEATPHNNTVTVTVKDKEGNEDQDQDTETVPFDELPQVEVSKTANVTEVVGTSGTVTFTVVVKNIGDVAFMLSALTDTDFGDLNGKGTCAVGGVIEAGDSYTCAFSGTVTGNEATPHNNTVTALVTDKNGNQDQDQDSETVIFDQLPVVDVTKSANVAEVVGTSGSVTFTVVVSNVGSVPFTITALSDSDFGNLNGKGTCATGSVIPAGGSYTCAFPGTVTGNEATPHNNTVTVTVKDKDNNQDQDEDSETVPFDELPQVEVTKTANVNKVVGTSGAVTFTIVVLNVGNVPFTIVTLTDSDFGNLNGKGTCATGAVIPFGGNYTCAFPGTITGNEATPHNNTVTVTVKDKDNNEDQDQDTETVPFDELPAIEVTKTANVAEMVGTSGPVTFTVAVKNIGNVAVTLTSLTDSDFGDLNGKGTCVTGGTIAVGGTYTCAFSGTITGNEATPHSNTVTATVQDKDGNQDQDQDTETVPFDELPSITVTKSANVTEVVGTSGPVQFTVAVENSSDVSVTLTSLTDSDFGNLDGQGNCATGGTIAAHSTYTCLFTKTITGNEATPHSNTVTATVEDKDGNEASDDDDATVPFDELPSVEVTKSANVTETIGTSGLVTFTVVVQNIGNVTVTLDSLVDSDFGDLNGQGTCATGSVIPVGGNYTCDFSGTVTGNESLPHSNTVAIVVKDKDGNEDTDEDEETVPFDELPSVQVTKTANVTEVVGTSGQVEFTVVVKNSSDVSVVLTSLTDSDFGDLNGKGTCATGGTLVAGDSYTCAFTETVTGDESTPHSNTVTATVEDADGNEASDSDDETVPFDELPLVEVTKSANPTTVIGTSGVVTFTVTVQNIGNVPVTLTSLNDSDFGDLNGKGTCATGGTIAVGSSYTCAFAETVTGDESTPHSNTVTVIVKDEDGNEDEEEDEETVPFDELPAVQVTKTANPTAVTGTSGLVTFTVTVENIGQVTVTLVSLTDSDFGNLNGQGTCATGGLIPSGSSYSCEFVETVTGSEATPHNNVVTAVVEDENGNEDSDEDDATVTFEGTPQVEVTKTANVSVITGTSGEVIFTIEVKNIGTLPVTLTSLVDSDFGDLNGKGTCATGGLIAVGGSYTCAFTETVTGSESLPHNNTVTVIVKDEDGNESEDEDDETVPFDELPSVEVSKSANVTQVVGTSGPVEFTIVVENNGNVPFVLTSLTDSDFGDLNGQGTCVTGGTIAVGGSYTCAFTVTITGDEATPHSNTVTVIVEDKDGNTDSDEDDETVPFDELPNSLGNRVWFDNDRNGIQDPGETGVPGVKVDLYRVDNAALAAATTDTATTDAATTDANSDELRAAASVFVATTTTDGNGEYLFTNLEAGSYYVEFATPAGYVFTRYDVNGNSQDTVDSDALVPFLSLGVTDDGAEAEEEGNTTYSISYTNNDATRQANNVVISATVPAGTSFVAEESSPEWSCTSTEEGGVCTFTRATMAPNTSATLLFVFKLKQAVSYPPTIDFEVFLTHSTPARTQTVALAEGDSNLTLDAGIVRTVGNESTPTPTGPTNLPGVDQPKQRIEMFLPSLSVNETAESSATEEAETEDAETEEDEAQQPQSTFLPSVESQE